MMMETCELFNSHTVKQSELEQLKEKIKKRLKILRNLS